MADGFAFSLKVKMQNFLAKCITRPSLTEANSHMKTRESLEESLVMRDYARPPASPFTLYVDNGDSDLTSATHCHTSCVKSSVTDRPT